MAKVIVAAALSASAIAAPALLEAEAAPLQEPHSHISVTARPLREATLLRALPLRAMLKQEVRAVAQKLRERRERQAERRAQREAQEAAEAAQAATPAPTYTAPVVSTGTLSQSYVAGLLRSAGFPESAIPTMLYIIGRESGFNPNAVNGGGSAYAGGPACGLVQLWPCPGPGALDPATNIRYGYQKYAASGFAPWSM